VKIIGVVSLVLSIVGSFTRASALPSIARTWDEEILSAIRIDRPNPPVHARNLFHFSVAMYDAWAAYDSVAVGYLYRGKHTAGNVAAARQEAISFAAYRILKERYALSLNASTTLAALDARMTALGYDKNNTSTDTSTPAGVGNSVFAAVSAWFISDGARQLQSYADYPVGSGGYVSANPIYLATGLPGTQTLDVNRWQPLAIANALDQNGNPIGPLQSYVGAVWLGVRPFALARTNATQPWINPGPQPQLGGVGDAQFRSEVVEVIRRSSELTPDDGAILDISPGAFGNSPLGTNDGTGHPMNPATGSAYAANVVKRGDFARVLAEFWADGPNSETPPGHWNTIANGVSDHPLFLKRFGGTGPVLDDLEWDVKLYFTLNAAVHEAACAAWSLKRVYDGGRPISYIRSMGQLGQSTQTSGPSYHPNGLPLVPGLIELVTSATSQPGQRHAGMPVGMIAIYAWPGQPPNPATQHSGAKWILAWNWLPFQKSTFVTPAFPGYISGHSTFSRSAAEVLTAITGSPFFPGGIGTYTAPAGTTLTFENGPSQTVVLQWASYYDAADQAGLSRLWGGIHISVDDLTGRRVGSQCGKGVWALVQRYFDGSVLSSPLAMAIRTSAPGEYQLLCDTLRGTYYKLQSTLDLHTPFTDEPGGFSVASDAVSTLTVPTLNQQKFFRIVHALAP
jgi:hypothetical protein